MTSQRMKFTVLPGKRTERGSPMASPTPLYGCAGVAYSLVLLPPFSSPLRFSSSLDFIIS